MIDFIRDGVAAILVHLHWVIVSAVVIGFFAVGCRIINRRDGRNS